MLEFFHENACEGVGTCVDISCFLFGLVVGIRVLKLLRFGIFTLCIEPDFADD